VIPRLSYVPGNTVLHRLDPRAKVICLVAGLAVMVLVADIASLSIILAAIIMLFAASGIGAASILKNARFIAYFAALIFLSQVIFIHQGRIIMHIPLLSLGGRALSLIITEGGILGGILITLRFLDIILASLLFISITNPSRLAYALMQSGIPYRLAFMLIIALRFIPIFDMESSIVKNAQQARGLNLGKGGIRGIWRQAKHTFFPLLASALSRVDGIAMSMDGRAFGLHKHRTYIEKIRFRGADWTISFAVIALAAFAIINWYL
jgi:energy-coupling factor transport system permease protein